MSNSNEEAIKIVKEFNREHRYRDAGRVNNSIDIVVDLAEKYDSLKLTKENEEKYKLTLFMVIRNSKVLPKGLELGKTDKEIHKMTIDVMNECMNMINYDSAKKYYEEGID